MGKMECWKIDYRKADCWGKQNVGKFTIGNLTVGENRMLGKCTIGKLTVEENRMLENLPWES